MLRRICTVQIQPGKHVLDYEAYTAPTLSQELDHTDHTDHTDRTDQEYIYLLGVSRPWTVGVDDLPEV